MERLGPPSFCRIILDLLGRGLWVIEHLHFGPNLPVCNGHGSDSIRSGACAKPIYLYSLTQGYGADLC